MVILAAAAAVGATFKKMAQENLALAERVFEACVSIGIDGEAITGQVLDGIFQCQKRLVGQVDLLTGEYLEILAANTLPGIQRAMYRELQIQGKGGPLVRAKAVLDLVNKGRRRKFTFA